MTMTYADKTQPARRARPPLLSRLVINLWLVTALLLLVAVVTALVPEFLDARNIATVAKTFAVMMIMVLGVTWVFAAGKIDVSFMQVAALANMVCAYALAQGFGWWAGIGFGLGAGMLAGLVNGWLVAVLGLPALIVTISVSGICASIAAALGKGTVIRIDTQGPFAQLLTPPEGQALPLIVLPVLGVTLVAWFVQERLALGRYIYAMGTNETALRSVGVPATRIAVLLYVLSGFCAALAGLLLAESLSSGQPLIGGPFLINGLTVVLLGGMMVRMGRPNILGTLTATLFVGVLFSAAALLGLPDWQRQIIQGTLLLAGLVVAVVANRSQHGKGKGI